MPRIATITRTTKETDITVTWDLDRPAPAEVATGIGFFDHMLETLGKHSGTALAVRCRGDLHIDGHHTTEDVGIALGQALRQALGAKIGIRRYADCLMPMDETLARVALDISGRAFLVFKADFPSQKIGTFDTELVREFFQAFAANAQVTLHAEALHGENSHHIAEALFKGLARVLRHATEIDSRAKDAVPSTKGTLSV